MTVDEGVILVKYNPHWPILYQQESKLLQKTLAKEIISIDHVGSTAIPDLSAKPIIDILIGLESLDYSDKIINSLEKIDYEKLKTAEQIFPERLFYKKIDKKTKQQYNLHITKHMGDFWTQLILFRNYLRTHPETMKEYELIKQHMAQRFPNNLIAYGIGKEGFIIAVVERAKKTIHK
ncbi:MAG: GrpB family protein [Candidatus Heimdallarchaeota archaeon]|nr:GrpB family protein [Candidatus Heimdallarchaeota archaeon]